MTLQWIGVTPNGRVTPSRDVAAVQQPVLLPAPAPSPASPAAPDARRVTAPAADATTLAGGVPDSLFDHSADVEFILDPVKLRKGRAQPVLRVNPNVQGEKAVITF